jgi:hypothetical protein
MSMPDTPAFLAERLKAEAEKSLEFFRELPENAWQQVIYSEGQAWTPGEVLAHFVATESSLLRLLENVLAGGSGSPQDFDIDAYNQRKVLQLANTPVPELYAQFQHHRQQTAALVESLQPSDLERQGRHPFLGMAPLSEIIKIIYRHNQIHQREIRKALSAAPPA